MTKRVFCLFVLIFFLVSCKTLFPETYKHFHQEEERLSKLSEEEREIYEEKRKKEEFTKKIKNMSDEEFSKTYRIKFEDEETKFDKKTKTFYYVVSDGKEDVVIDLKEWYDIFTDSQDKILMDRYVKEFKETEEGKFIYGDG